jgi:2-methylcitrate dehydratase PrpD
MADARATASKPRSEPDARAGVGAVPLTLALAERCVALRADELPVDVARIARQALLDWFAVTLGGSSEQGPATLLAALLADGPTGVCTVVGREERLPPRDAALLNGTASHSLDFDDVSIAFPCHASAAVLAAAIALAEQHDATVRELLTAYVAGYETTCAVANSLGPGAYARGAHLTGTAGAPGAAAACAKLLGLDAERTATAIGIAASGAGGLKCNFGTMTKALHAGRACETGLLAATLAARGFTASTGAIEDAQGLAAVVGEGAVRDVAAGADAESHDAVSEGAATRRWYLRENLFKHHASCFYTHSMLEGIAELRASGLTSDHVERVTVHVGELELGACAIARPRTGLEVKFSLAHLAALALLGRSTSAIVDADADDAEAIALRSRVLLAPGATAGEPTRVDVLSRDGSAVSACVDVNEPERDLQRQGQRLAKKFTALAAPVLGDEGAVRLLAALTAPDGDGRVHELTALARR